MKLSVIIPALGLIALAASAPDAFAFQTVTNDQFPSTTLSTKLADPDDIIQDMSQRYTGSSATIFHSGNMTIGITGSGGGFAAAESPFVADPAMGTVLSKRQW
ncbi:MAG TPA: hypothetical protein VH020_06100 [Stellaceae bacterium]|jgi:hypothetical protein|nr:hypothetical protein [Stellaceae bacterium]